MGWRVLVTARAFWVSGQAAEATLTEAGCEVVRSPVAGPIELRHLIELLQGYDAIIAASDPYNTAIFAGCPQLKMVSRCGIGIDRIDLEAATEAGIIVTNTPGAMSEAVADYTFALMLALARQIVTGDILMRSGGWTELPGIGLPGKTLGLVGFGRIGKAVARRAAGFGMRILACDPPLEQAGYVADGTRDAVPSVPFVSLEHLLAESDFVSLHAPAIPETRNLFDAARFAQMKPSACFINTARGALTVEADLCSALETGQIAGAAVDVYQQEPLPADHPLRRAPRCVLAPHNAFNTFEAATEMSRQAAQNILTVLRGEHPTDTCNAAVWEVSHLRLKRTGA